MQIATETLKDGYPKHPLGIRLLSVLLVGNEHDLAISNALDAVVRISSCRTV